MLKSGFITKFKKVIFRKKIMLTYLGFYRSHIKESLTSFTSAILQLISTRKITFL